MGVIKNLMVRVGADVSGVVSGMKRAGSATASAKQSIQNSTGGIRKTIKNSFDPSRLTIKQYTQTVKDARLAHETTTAQVQQLTQRLTGMKDVYKTVSQAMDGLDPGKSLQEQISQAEQELIKIEHRRKELEKSTGGATAKQQRGATYAKQIQELQTLGTKSQIAEQNLERLNTVMKTLEQIRGFDANVSLEQMQRTIRQTEIELNGANLAAERTGQTLNQMGSVRGFALGRVLRNTAGAIGKVGSTALKVGRVELTVLWNALRKIGSVALSGAWRGISRIGSVAVSAAKGGLRLLGNALRSIRSSAASGAGGLGNMVRQIRNIGLVSVGMKLVGGTFGRLRSLISNYISTNDELNASVSLLKNQLGQALEPAIRLVVAAMQKLVPVAQKAASAINAVLKSVIGDIGDVQYAFRNLGTYGFDQITKADKEEDGGSTEQKQSALVRKLTGWIAQLKSAFTAGNWGMLGKLLGDGINSAISAIDGGAIGGKLAVIVNNVVTTISSLFATADFGRVGSVLASSLNGVLSGTSWDRLGSTLGNVILALPKVAVDFAQKLNWSSFANAVSNALHGALTTATAWIRETDWVKLGQGIRDFALTFHWSGLGTDVSDLLKAALTAATDWVRGTDWMAVGKSVLKFVEGFDWAGVANALLTLVKTAIGATDYGAIGSELNRKLTAAVQSIRWSNMGASVATGLNSVLARVNSAITGFDWTGAAAGLAGQLNDLVTGFDWAGLGTTISNACTTALGSIRSAITTFNWKSLGSKIAKGVNSIDFAAILTDLGGLISDVLVGALDIIAGFAQKIDWAKLGGDIWNGLWGVVTGIDWGGLISGAIDLVGAALGGARNMIGGLVTAVGESIMDGLDSVKEYWAEQMVLAGGDVWQGFLNGIVAGVTGIADWIVTNIWRPFTNCFFNAFGIHSPSTKAAVWGGHVWQGFLNGIKNGVAGIADWIVTNVWHPFKKCICNAFGCGEASPKAGKWGSNVISGFLGGVKSGFASIATWVTKNLWKPFSKAFGDTFSGLQTQVTKIFTDIQNAVKTPINGLLGFINSMMSGICEGINTIINGLNSINVEIPDWGIFGELRGQSFGFNIPTVTATAIPLLARGGIVNGPTQLIAGEKGKEAIVPLENNTEWIDRVADKMTARVSGGGSAQPMILQIFLGKRKLTEYVIQDINQITKTTGVCPINV